MSFPAVRRLCLLAVTLALPSAGQAALDLCNDTTAAQRVAIGFQEAGDWTSKGWWDLPAGSCTEVLSSASISRFYYLRVETEGWAFTDDRLGFCVADTDFEIKGEDGCARRGFRQENFARIDTRGAAAPDPTAQTRPAADPDTGSDAARRTFTHHLSAHLTPIKSDVPARHVVQSGFSTKAVFQGCDAETTAYASFCTFIGAGRRYLVYDDGRTSAALWKEIQQAIRGRRYTLEGLREDLFDTTSELVLRAIRPEPEDRSDQLLASLQGFWRSTIDPNDSFRVSGAERINAYAGAETSVEYLSLHKPCAEAGDEGPFLFTWDNNSGTSLCYAIARLTDTVLALIYLPRGTELVYRREG
jgi:uncharacterized membrane protein